MLEEYLCVRDRAREQIQAHVHMMAWSVRLDYINIVMAHVMALTVRLDYHHGDGLDGGPRRGCQDRDNGNPRHVSRRPKRSRNGAIASGALHERRNEP